MAGDGRSSMIGTRLRSRRADRAFPLDVRRAAAIPTWDSPVSWVGDFGRPGNYSCASNSRAGSEPLTKFRPAMTTNRRRTGLCAWLADCCRKSDHITVMATLRIANVVPCNRAAVVRCSLTGTSTLCHPLVYLPSTAGLAEWRLTKLRIARLAVVEMGTPPNSTTSNYN